MSGSTAAAMEEVHDDDLLPMIHLEDLYDDPSTLSSVLVTHGAFYLLDPPLPPAPWTAASRLFSLLPEEKTNLKHPKGLQIRGYNSDPRSGREWWDLTPESTDGCAGPQNDDSFRDETKGYFSAAVKLLSALTEVLRDTYPAIPAKALEQGMSTMRLLRYSKSLIPPTENPHEPPPTPPEGVMAEDTEGREKDMREANAAHHAQTSRMQPHTDHGVLTLMDADSRGLYVYGPDGRVYAAPPVKNAVIVFAADSLCWWTRDEEDGKRILPVPHEVWMTGEQERMSLAVFFRPSNDVVLYDLSKVESTGKGKGKEKAEEKAEEEGEGEKRRNEMTYGRWSYEKGRIKGRRCWLIGRDPLGDSQATTVADQ